MRHSEFLGIYEPFEKDDSAEFYLMYEDKAIAVKASGGNAFELPQEPAAIHCI